MSQLPIEMFDGFFEAVWNHRPFAWQRELARLVLDAQAHEGGWSATSWPEAIALPTAAGKTACIDIAVFALAAQADRRLAAQPLSAPRRIFFTVDRRVIVDEAFERARSLAEALENASSGVVREIADRLRRIGDSALPLAVHSLRGGQLRSDAWAATPLQPTVIATTVDQVGSRLLFRGYGPGQGMWPVHAGLVGNDALILLDEAHCAQPMLETLQSVKRWRSWAEMPLRVPFEVAVLSATPPASVRSVFRDESTQRLDPTHPLGKRQLASKTARLVVAEKAKGRSPAHVRGELASVLAQQARSLEAARSRSSAVGDLSEATTGAPAIVVFCNRVDTARKVWALLSEDAADVYLLTGRMRPIDKDDVVVTALAPLAARCAGERRLSRPCFVVTTQTLEVGADLDFDALVTECASLDALRQRFGRLNRGGRPIAAQATIVVAARDIASDVVDPVYGGAISATWSWLSVQAAQSPDATIDFGVLALEPRLPAGDDLVALNAPQQHAPVLLPTHVDALVQTSPTPKPSPEVALFLHGVQSGPADVQVCWRADVSSDEPLSAVDALLRCPPSSPECLSVPFIQMKRWLDGAPADSGVDVEGAFDDDAEPGPSAARSTQGAGAPRRGLRWRGRHNSEVVEGGASLQPGDVIVVPASLGGWDELATLGAHPTADWGDRAHAAVRRDAVLRLHRDVLAQWPGVDARELLDEALSKGQTVWEDDPAGFVSTLQSALTEWATSLVDPQWEWLRAIVLAVASLPRLERAMSPHPGGGWIVEVQRRRTVLPSSARDAAAAFFGDEDDASSSGHFQSLLIEPNADGRSHLAGVGALARSYAEGCGLPRSLVETIGQAGDGHDLGKADPRFQAWLRNGISWLGGPLLAKSAELPQGTGQNRAARERAGYPDGARHELLSVRLLESCEAALPEDAQHRSLLLHLVESHHGFCRPFAPVVFDNDPLEVMVEVHGRHLRASSATGLEQVDAGPADRFWQLTRRYGWWGLAWLEALLRLADHRRSEWEQWHGRE